MGTGWPGDVDEVGALSFWGLAEPSSVNAGLAQILEKLAFSQHNCFWDLIFTIEGPTRSELSPAAEIRGH